MYLSQVPPVIFDIGTKVLDLWQEQKVKRLVPDFPGIFEKAQTDWAKLKEGAKAGLFTTPELSRALQWFEEFPRLWETIRPNFLKDESGRVFGGKVDDFIGEIIKHPLLRSSGQLGIPVAVVAGVLIVGGIAASLWAIEFIKRQQNISAMIDGVVAGKIPPEVLREAIEKQKGAGLFGELGGLVKYGLMAIAGLYLLPLVVKR